MASTAEKIAAEALKLSTDDKLVLIHLLMESITPPELPELTPAHKAELERRIKRHEADPSRAIPFEQAMEEIHEELERRRRTREGRANAS
ncbi:MAG: hypothetical protein ICCCNLDF_01036 [Planctomycetes bacterium]|nr:hypothetical protein [Planctomycetota bacterium]